MNMSVNTQELAQLHKAIESFLYRFDELAEKFGFNQSYKALRRQYLDICCNGDAIINNVIKGLVSEDTHYYVNLMEEYLDQPTEVTRLINEYLIETVNDLYENNLDLPMPSM